MSTGRINNKKSIIVDNSQRLAKIAKFGEVIFHTKDLANLWQIKSANTLHTTLTRYVKRGILFRIYRGFYSIKPISDLDPLILGAKALHDFSYVTTETVLNKEGIILQAGGKITFASPKSKKFSIGKNNYYSRKLADQYLYNAAGVNYASGVKIANLERALADMLYFNSKAYFDAEKFIDWKKVKRMQEQVGYPLTPKRYDFTKSKRRQA